MKKVLKLFAIMAVMLIVLTGCVNVNYEVTLNSDGTADVAYIYGFEKEYLEQMETTSEEMTKEMQENAELSDYTVEAYSDEKLEGFKASKHVTDFADISLEEAFGEENVKDSDNNRLKVEKKGSKTVYSQNAEIDLSSMDTSMATMVTMKYTIKLPTKVGNNNASEVSEDGKTLTWNLKAGEINKVEFEATELGTAAKIIRVAIIIVAVIVGIVIIALIIKLIIKKTKKQKNEKETDENIKEENKLSEEEKINENLEENKTEENKPNEEGKEE